LGDYTTKCSDRHGPRRRVTLSAESECKGQCKDDRGHTAWNCKEESDCNVLAVGKKAVELDLLIPHNTNDHSVTVRSYYYSKVSSPSARSKKQTSKTSRLSFRKWQERKALHTVSPPSLPYRVTSPLSYLPFRITAYHVWRYPTSFSPSPHILHVSPSNAHMTHYSYSLDALASQLDALCIPTNSNLQCTFSSKRLSYLAPNFPGSHIPNRPLAPR
jgi:hypothetical protein